jgi:hypothetical protein
MHQDSDRGREPLGFGLEAGIECPRRDTQEGHLLGEVLL